LGKKGKGPDIGVSLVPVVIGHKRLPPFCNGKRATESYT